MSDGYKGVLEARRKQEGKHESMSQLTKRTAAGPPARVSAAAPQGHVTLASWCRRIAPYLFLLPAIVLVGGWLLWPFARTAYLSSTEYDGLGEATFVSVDNYTRLMRDPVLIDSLTNTLFWVIGTLLLPVGIGLLIAVLTFDLTGGALYRLPFLIPYAISGTAVGVMWEFMLRSNGALNSVLQPLGLEELERSWLVRPPV